MQEQLSALLAKAQTELAALKTRPEFEAAKARFVGPNGELTALMKQMGSVPKDQRPALGKLINETKARVQLLLDEAFRTIEALELQAKLGPAVEAGRPEALGVQRQTDHRDRRSDAVLGTLSPFVVAVDDDRVGAACGEFTASACDVGTG